MNNTKLAGFEGTLSSLVKHSVIPTQCLHREFGQNETIDAICLPEIVVEPAFDALSDDWGKYMRHLPAAGAAILVALNSMSAMADTTKAVHGQHTEAQWRHMDKARLSTSSKPATATKTTQASVPGSGRNGLATTPSTDSSPLCHTDPSGVVGCLPDKLIRSPKAGQEALKASEPAK